MPDGPIQSRDWLVLSAILVLAAVLRIVGLDAPLWYDEIVTVITHLRLPWDAMMTEYQMNHHYLFSFQAKAAMEAFGETAWSVRLPAALFGIASVAAIWWLVRDISGVLFAHLTALLTAISYHHIWFSQNARGYTELMFWSVLGLGLYLRGLRQPTLGTWAAFAVVLALAAFTHLTGVFFFAALGVVWLGWLLVRSLGRKGVTRHQMAYPFFAFAGGLILAALAYLPVLPGIVRNTGEVGGTSAVSAMQEYQNPIWTVLETVSTLGAQGALALGVLVVSISLALIGAIRLKDREPLVGFVVFGHILLTMAALYAVGMRIWPRFFFVDIGLLLFLILEGVAAVCYWLGARIPALKKALFPLAVTGMIAISALLAIRNYMAPKQDFAGAIRFVESSLGPEDRVYILGVGAYFMERFYNPGWNVVELPSEFDSVRTASTPAWLIVPFPSRTLRTFEGIESEFEFVQALPGTLGDGTILIFRRD